MFSCVFRVYMYTFITVLFFLYCGGCQCYVLAFSSLLWLLTALSCYTYVVHELNSIIIIIIIFTNNSCLVRKLIQNTLKSVINAAKWTHSVDQLSQKNITQNARFGI